MDCECGDHQLGPCPAIWIECGGHKLVPSPAILVVSMAVISLDLALFYEL